MERVAEARAWGEYFAEITLKGYLDLVDELRRQARAELLADGLTPKTAARLRAVLLAASGASVPAREALQAIAVATVARHLPEIRSAALHEVSASIAILLGMLGHAIGGDDGAKLASVPVDAETIGMFTQSRREALGATAWLMVRAGALVGRSRGIEPRPDSDFGINVKRAKGALQAVTKKQGRL